MVVVDVPRRDAKYSALDVFLGSYRRLSRVAAGCDVRSLGAMFHA